MRPNPTARPLRYRSHPVRSHPSLSQLSGKRVPHLVKQRRDFVIAWLRQALARTAHDNLLSSPLPSSPAKRVEANPLHHDDRRMSEQKSALGQLLGVYGAPDRVQDGAYELRVPNEHLQIVCSQVANLTGLTMPRQPRARREWLAEIAMQMQQRPVA